MSFRNVDRMFLFSTFAVGCTRLRPSVSVFLADRRARSNARFCQKLNFAPNSIVRFSLTTDEITPLEAGLLMAELGTLKLG